MGKSLLDWYNKEVDQLESLVKSNECDEQSTKYDLETILKAYAKEEKSQGGDMKLFKYTKS